MKLWSVLAAGLVLSLGLFAGCGRSLPEDQVGSVPEGGDPTGAFGGEEEGLGGRIRVAGAAAGLELVRVAAAGFRKEEPGVSVKAVESPVDDALAGLCAGRVEVAVTDRALSAAEKRTCEREAEGAVYLHVAGRAGRPVGLVTTNAILFERFEVEGLLQFLLDDAARVASDAGLQPLSVEELDQAQSAFEQALAGI